MIYVSVLLIFYPIITTFSMFFSSLKLSIPLSNIMIGMKVSIVARFTMTFAGTRDIEFINSDKTGKYYTMDVFWISLKIIS